MESTADARPVKQDFTLKQVVKILLESRWFIICITLLVTLAAGSAAWLLPRKYQAIILISPTASTAGGGQLGALGSIASQFGGLASLTGLGATGDSKKAESIATLQSEALTIRYIQQNDLLPVLYPKLWDEKTKTWTEKDPSKVPTLWKANQMFKKGIRAIMTDTKSGLVTLTITWTDAKIAANWANGLVSLTNQYLREKAIAESERNIAYLTDQAARTNVIEARQAIYSILQNELNKMMLARGNDEYAFKIVDPASPPEKPSYPQPLSWLLLGVFGGLFLSMAMVLGRWSWKSS